MSVKTKHPDYVKLAPLWKRARDVCAGQQAVHAAGEEYLPKLTDQTLADYAAFKLRALFYNASWRTVSGLHGMLFRKPPTLEVAAGLKDLLKDVTLSGVPLERFVEAIALETLKVERVGILVDHPPQPDATARPTVAQAEKMGLRPTMQMYPAESIINWRFETINNQHTLAMVVLQETYTEKVNEFEVKERDQWRVLDLDPDTDSRDYRVRIFRDDAKGGDQIISTVYPVMAGKRLSHIPFYCDLAPDEPPLIDLFDVNLSHYRTTASYEHGCHFTGLPTAVISGYQIDPDKPETFYIGSSNAWVFPSPDATANYLEFTGTGLTALKDNLQAKQQYMAMLGARMLADESKQVETLGATAIKRTGENSVLSSLAIQISDRVQKALEMFAQWAGVDGDEEFEINRDFLPAGLDAQTITAYIALVQSGALSPESLHDLLLRGDLTKLKYEEEQAKIDAAPPPKPLAAPEPAKPQET